MQFKQSNSECAAKIMEKVVFFFTSFMLDFHNPEATMCNLLFIYSVIYFLKSKLSCNLHYTDHTDFVTFCLITFTSIYILMKIILCFSFLFVLQVFISNLLYFFRYAFSF